LKAGFVARLRPHDLVIGADTVVSLNGRTFGKPANLREARSMLRALSGKTHTVITGICLIREDRCDWSVRCDETKVTFRRLSEARISNYLRRVHVLDKAGAYGIQEHGDELVKSIRGSYSNVVGLPLESLQKEIASFPGLRLRTRRRGSRT
jgi:septum formation protein